MSRSSRTAQAAAFTATITAAKRPYKTFLDWGAAVPFTTPVLAHARVRPGPNGAVDLVMPNPSGGKGMYVVDFGAVGELFTLTLHDRLLVERLLALPAITPGAVRKAALELAAEGAAGRAARRAAEAAEAEEQASAALIEFGLINGLLALGGVGGIDWRRLTDGDGAFRGYLRGRLREVAPRVGSDADELLSLFGEVGAAASRVGAPGSDRPSRNERQIAQLAAFAASVRAWAGDDDDDPADDPERLARDAVGCAQRTLTEARQSQEAARGLLADVMALVRAWQADAAACRESFARPEWLLDGWQQVCAMWEAAAPEPRATQQAVLAQVRLLIPFLDRTAMQDADRVREERLDRGRRVRLHEDWRTGLVLGAQTARSEAMRAAVL
jgi:hypothetical protein